MPGFRPGKAPRRLLEARIGTEVAREQALRDSLPEYYVEAVDAEDIDVIAPPEIEITAGEDDGDVEFDAVVEVRPQVHLDGLRRAAGRDRRARRSTDEAVDRQVDALRERFADLEDSDRAAHRRRLRRDRHQGLDRRRVDRGPHRHRLPLRGRLRASSCPSSTRSCAASARATSSSSTTTLPERFGERAGDEVAFQVLVKEAKQKVLPELTDEWVAEVSEFETVDELRADIRKRLEHVRASCRRRWRVRDKVLEAAADLVPVEAPETLVDQRDGAPARTTSRTGSTHQGVDDPAVPRGDRPGPAGVRRRACAAAPPRRCSPTSRCARSSPRRRSRRPTTRSTPRSTGWPSGSSEKPAKVRQRSRTEGRAGGGTL